MKLNNDFIAWPALVLAAVLSLGLSSTAGAQNLPDTIEKIKPAIVGIGTFQRTRRPPSIFRGTGFVIADGLHIVTNAHVFPEKVDSERKEIVAVFAGKTNAIDIREATKVAESRDHDIAVLKITGGRYRRWSWRFKSCPRGGKPLPSRVSRRHGTRSQCGHSPSNDSGGKPIVIPQLSVPKLGKESSHAAHCAHNVYPLDATAYPGNSGSPLYHPESGQVVGIINKVFIQETKESVLQKPSGISYAFRLFISKLLKKNSFE